MSDKKNYNNNSDTVNDVTKDWEKSSPSFVSHIDQFKENKEFTYIVFDAYKLIDQASFSLAVNGSSTNVGEHIGQFKFLVDYDNFTETISHDWGEYDSMAGRLAQKIADTGKTVQDFNSLMAGGEAGLKTALSSTGDNQEVIAKTIRNSLGGVARNEVAQYKVDSSFVYQGTKRRNYTITTSLAYQGGNNDGEGTSNGRYKQVVEPIKRLEYLTCPLSTDGISIEFPAIFRVYTEPSGFLNIPHCAILSVQPQWSGPWVGGMPSKCELTLDIADIDPLYKNTFSGQWPAIEVTSTGGNDEG